MENYYVLEVRGKNLYGFLKYLNKEHIDILSIRYLKDKMYITLDYKNYLKILKIKTSYQLKLINIKGIKKIWWIFLNNKIFLSFFILSILVIVFFSNIIFKISYIDVDPKIEVVIKEELEKLGIFKYSMKKSYKDVQIIKDKIKNEHRDLIEWIEIENRGMVYNIKVIKRIKNDTKEEKEPCNIVARKDGFILSINASSGEVVKDPGDYVSTGDVIVSGIIRNNDKVVALKKADADVYAETWYKITVIHPINFLKKEANQKAKKFYYFSLLGKRINLYRENNKFSLIKEKKIIDNNIFCLVREYKTKDNYKKIKYDYDTLQKIMEDIAHNKMMELLLDNDEIILQKTLKKRIENDKMNIEVFFKVKENIKEERKINLNEEKYD